MCRAISEIISGKLLTETMLLPGIRAFLAPGVLQPVLISVIKIRNSKGREYIK
jgi:hypothetical protein